MLQNNLLVFTGVLIAAAQLTMQFMQKLSTYLFSVFIIWSCW